MPKCKSVEEIVKFRTKEEKLCGKFCVVDGKKERKLDEGSGKKRCNGSQSHNFACVVRHCFRESVDESRNEN